ncbi:hypothetical protein [Micromonospora zhanjiangensis]|uniref:Uncharacterized protein n=1 Tax=Micromonospora zhanjiangensis TaxID=1522057 RepID=A0ABV8KW14_9ACTN
MIELAGRINFGRRYYERLASLDERAGRQGHHPDRAELAAVLAETGLDFVYSARECFFEHAETHGGFEIVMTASFRTSSAEFMLYVTAGDVVAGGPYPRLARQVVQAVDPDFTPEPFSPKLPFANAEQLRECVRFAAALFEDFRDEFINKTLG